MPTAQTALIVTVVAFSIVAFHAFYSSFVESPLKYEGLPWFHNNAGFPPRSHQNGGGYLIGVGKADITG
jgi:hypothetical protein